MFHCYIWLTTFWYQFHFFLLCFQSKNDVYISILVLVPLKGSSEVRDSDVFHYIEYVRLFKLWRYLFHSFTYPIKLWNWIQCKLFFVCIQFLFVWLKVNIEYNTTYRWIAFSTHLGKTDIAIPPNPQLLIEIMGFNKNHNLSYSIICVQVHVLSFLFMRNCNLSKWK